MISFLVAQDLTEKLKSTQICLEDESCTENESC